MADDYEQLKQKAELYASLERLAEQIKQDTAEAQAHVDRLTAENEVRDLERWFRS
jgi:hypothetical protein